MDTAADRCQACGTPLPTAHRVGRPRCYCSATCRSAARRARRRAEKAGGTALSAGLCTTDIAGHSCGRVARFAVMLNRRETRLCGPCYEAAMDFLISQGVTARDVRTVRLTGLEAQPPTPPTVPAPAVGGPGRCPRVLLIEDDKALVTALEMLLRQRGDYLVSHASDGATGLREAYAQRPDLVLLDIMLPGIDGIEVLRRLRSVSDVPVIFLTARNDDQDLVIGLAAGADDYIVKPFRVDELLARIARVLRRHGGREDQEPVYEDGLLRLDSLSLEAHVLGKPLELTATEFRLLNLLVRNAGTVQPFGNLLATAWNDPGGQATSRVKFTISRLRRKLDATPLGGNAIVSARGIGYFYRPPSTPRASAAVEAPRAGHGHADRILDILNHREGTPE
ncbi:response regulator transcription factor [Streptomyces sp. NRRL F-5126]|uniref:response regulator transcription factor n=1 Tax=Streptomyces sp. NRRL F-5126 TaxID=1463857 RepID=UPI0018FE48AB|nr:response regulator transcription factor [Streptomyces sp. NRRL F-5126]